MVAARCERFPEGEAFIRTTAGIVLFVDGVAEVESPELVEALREVPDEFGISVEKPSEPPPPPPPAPAPEPEPEVVDGVPVERPAQSASKAAWIEWAASHGMDRDQADDLTKAELIELADQLAKE
ncbi:hypothetical protein ACFXJ8_11910 [Nonomuraea sp. NPDC059194]|uniref:hypothetical protein n=1 Tax=Nonomuraea sp. NPDC059194 TaxID=3346764 RepID=UPI0036996BE9